MSDIPKKIEEVRKKIEVAKKTPEQDVLLIAVTKTHPPEMINEAIGAGITDIGENKVQEILEKYDKVLPVRWHMIGHLQTNKVKYIIDKVCLIHSVDSVKLMDEIERQAVKHGITMEILIEVNIAGEETKFGVSLDGVDELLVHAGGLSNVRVVGLMTVLPKNATNISRRLHFNDILNKFFDISLNKYDNVNMKYLSLGMSGDYEEAVSCGSIMVRVGRAIFGERYYG